MMVVMGVDGGKTSKVRKFGRARATAGACHFYQGRVKHHLQPPSPPSFLHGAPRLPRAHTRMIE
jgi:hypothetical protein